MLIALEGQTAAHIPQFMHRDLSTWATIRSSEADTVVNLTVSYGQAVTHVPHPAQSASSTTAVGPGGSYPSLMAIFRMAFIRSEIWMPWGHRW